jgi:transporter family-2 protein
MKAIFFYLLSFIAGCASPMQSGMNGTLSRNLNSPFLSGAISNFIGCLLMVIVAILYARGQPLTTPVGTGAAWWMWLGGLLSAVIVTVSLSAPQQIGFASFTTVVLAGQMGMALLIDATGMLGNTVIPLNLKKIAGMALIVAGVYLVKK